MEKRTSSGELHDQRQRISRKRVAWLMREAGLRAKRKRQHGVTTRRDACHPVAPHLLQRDFTARQILDEAMRPGWQVHGHVEGLIRHIILSGRDPAPLSVSIHRAILELTDELTRDQSIDPLQVSQAIRQALPPEDQPEITFGTGFFSKDASPLSSQERRDVLNRLFSELLENGQMKRGEERS